MSKLKRKKRNHDPPFVEIQANHQDEANMNQNSLLNVTSTTKIFERAIASAEKHGIKLEPGKKMEVMEIAATSQLFST